MPRQKKKGLDFFYLDCDIFSSASDLKPLIRRYKADGLALFVHILCDVYSKGYFFKPDNYDDYLFELADDIGITVEKVQLILTFMADRTLLDAISLNKNTVFTSHGIQKHYAEAMKGRKHSVAEIKGEHWILSENEEAELDTFYKSNQDENKSEKNTNKSEKNTDKSEINNTNKIKGNKRKEKEIKGEDNIDSKKVSNKKNIASYDEIFDEMVVSEKVKAALIEFIRHLSVNGTVLINSRLEDIIINLDIMFRQDDQAKADYIRDAIRKGYKRLPFEGE